MICPKNSNENTRMIQAIRKAGTGSDQAGKILSEENIEKDLQKNIKQE